MKKFTLILLGIVAASSVNAQVLKLEDAIALALSNNHNVIITKQQNEAKKQDIHPGAVGFLPTVDASAGGSYNASTTDQEFATDAFPDIKNQEAAQSSQSAKVTASYMIFNGGGRVRSYAKLKSSGALSELQTKISLESTMIQVVNSYYEVVRVGNQLDLIKGSLEISRDRLNRVKTNNSYGNAAKIDVLNAQVDFNNDSSNLMHAELNLKKSKNELNFLLGRTIVTKFDAEGELTLPVISEASDYINKAKENNTSIIMSNIQLGMAELDKKINKSGFMPTLSSSLDYGYQGSANDVGIVRQSGSVGTTAALSLKWNLFDGLKKQKALEKAKIMIEVNNTQQQQTLLNIEKEVQNYYDAIKVNIDLLSLEKSNLTVGKINLTRSKELFKNGSINNVQFRQAQLNLIQIENKINNYKYAIKVYEYQLLRMTNELVK
jgi:outer membrane protein TolC